jgi:hypothetical protein
MGSVLEGAAGAGRRGCFDGEDESDLSSRHAAWRPMSIASGCSAVSPDVRRVFHRADLVVDDTSPVGDDAKLADAETSLATDALQAERRADVLKGLSAVADLELRLQKANPNAKPAIDVELKAAREALAKAERTAAAPIDPHRPHPSNTRRRVVVEQTLRDVQRRVRFDAQFDERAVEGVEVRVGRLVPADVLGGDDGGERPV